MRKVFGVILKVIAGFFFYMVSLLAFVSEPPTSMKMGILIGFSLPAVVTLSGGLALTRFCNWKRDTGIVLLCASGLTAFVTFTFGCMYMTEEFQKMIKPDTLAFFNDYLTGSGVIVGFAILGGVFVKASKGKTEQSFAPGDESSASNPHS